MHYCHVVYPSHVFFAFLSFVCLSLIREILSLSQSVRTLLHLRRPGRYEQVF